MKRLLLLIVLSSTQVTVDDSGKVVSRVATDYCVTQKHLKGQPAIDCANAVATGFQAGFDYLLAKIMKVLPGDKYDQRQ